MTFPSSASWLLLPKNNTVVFSYITSEYHCPGGRLFLKCHISNLPSRFANPILLQEKRPLDTDPNQNFVYFYYYPQSAKHPDLHNWREM